MPNFSDRDLNDLLRVIDTNGNGVVEYDELHGTHSRAREQMEHIGTYPTGNMLSGGVYLKCINDTLMTI